MMFRPGNIGHLGRLGLVAASQPSLVTKALAILAKYGSSANLYLPGVGQISGIQAGNWLDSAGTTAATVDGSVGLVVSAGKPIGPERVTITSVVLSGATSVSVGAALVAGRMYSVYALVTGYSGTGDLGFDGSTFSASAATRISGNGVISGVALALGGSSIGIFGRASNAATLSNISIRELPGSHMTQATSANRPILRLSGGVYAWDFVSSDSFNSTMTPGNAGFFCSGVNVTDSGVLRTLLGAGAGSDASHGVWLARAASNALTLQVGNGTTRNSVSATYPVATSTIASAGWDSSSMFVGVNNTETSSSKTVNCTSTNTINIGVLTGTTNPMLGTMGATVIIQSALPTVSERAILRQFIASLSGVTL